MGKRAKADIEVSLIQIQEWMAQAISTAQIERSIIENEWCKSERQAKRLVKIARERFREEHTCDIKDARILKEQELIKLRDSLHEQYKGTPNGMKAIATVERMIIKLKGLDAPVKIEVTGKDGGPIEVNHNHRFTIDWGMVPTEALRALMAARKPIQIA